MLPSREEQKKVVKRVAQVFRNEMAAGWDNEFDAYLEGLNFILGLQYTPDQISYYKKQRRPTNVWNLYFPIVNQILGSFIINWRAQRIQAQRRSGSNILDPLVQDLCDDVDMENSYRDEMAKTLAAGMNKRGFTHVRWSDERDSSGSVVIDNTDEAQILFDSRATRDYLQDGQYMLRSRWLTVDRIFALWPQHRAKLKEIAKDRETSAYWEAQDEAVSGFMESHHFTDERNGLYRVIEFHDREFGKAGEVVYDPASNQSEVLTLEGRKRDLFIKQNPHLQLVETNAAETITVSTVIPALNFFLEKQDADVQDGFFDYFNFSPYTYGRRTLDHFGVFQNAKGPQKEVNDTRNRQLDIINKSANTAMAVKPSKLRNWRDVKTKGNEPGLIIEVKDEAQIDDAIKRYEPPRHPFANAQISESSISLLDRIVSVTENWRGDTQTANENATLFASRVREASKSFAPVDRNIKRHDAMVWNRCVKLAQKHYTDQQIFAFAGSGMEAIQDIPSTFRNGKFMVLPSSEETNPTMRSVRFMERTELIKLVSEIFGPMAVDPRFWLEDAPMEKVQQLITAIENAQGAQGASQENAEAMQHIQGLLSAAQQRMALDAEGAPELPASTESNRPEKR